MVRKKTNWHTRGICPCGWHRSAPHGSLFHIHKDVCPKCGTKKERDGVSYNWTTARMRKQISRKEIDPVLWKPWTWFGKTIATSSEWIVHPDDRDRVEKHLRDNASING
jgi:ribosomal protein L37E